MGKTHKRTAKEYEWEKAFEFSWRRTKSYRYRHKTTSAPSLTGQGHGLGYSDSKGARSNFLQPWTWYTSVNAHASRTILQKTTLPYSVPALLLCTAQEHCKGYPGLENFHKAWIELNHRALVQKLGLVLENSKCPKSGISIVTCPRRIPRQLTMCPTDALHDVSNIWLWLRCIEYPDLQNSICRKRGDRAVLSKIFLRRYSATKITGSVGLDLW